MTASATNKRTRPIAIFLWVVIIFLLLLVGALVWTYLSPASLPRLAYTPTTPFSADSPLTQPDYAKEDAWLVHPDVASKYALMRPKGVSPVGFEHKDKVDIFYIHPTSGFDKKRWNAAYDDIQANARSNALAVKSHVTAFAPYGRVFAPKYRQANFGAFFADMKNPEEAKSALSALQLAYGDVVASFRYYLNNLNEGRPFIIAAHSQGSLHALPLLMLELKGKEAGARLVAAYIIGWPISVEQDLPAIGFPACDSAVATGCMIGWQSFGIEADPSMLVGYMNTTPAFSGQPRKGTTMLCTNPLTWTVGGKAGADKHQGAVDLVVDSSPLPAIASERVGAECTPEGVLKLDTLLKGNIWEQYQMPGMNMHAYDYNIFYMNLRDNVGQRIEAWLKTHP